MYILGGYTVFKNDRNTNSVLFYTIFLPLTAATLHNFAASDNSKPYTEFMNGNRRSSHVALPLLCMTLLSIAMHAHGKNLPMKLWYESPAKEWMTAALPLGNGELGAMFFGGVSTEQIQLNEKTLWTGSQTRRGAYQNLGDILISFPGDSTYRNYRRELDINEAIGKVSYTAGGTSFVREYFVSNPDSVMVVRINTQDHKRGGISMSVSLNDAHTGNTSMDATGISISGNLDHISYNARLGIIAENGTTITIGNELKIIHADAVTIILAAGTNYDITSPDYIGATPAQLNTKIASRVESAKKRGYDSLRKRHTNDYRNLFNRVSLDLDVEEPDIPTDKLVRHHNDSRYLDELYFQYGRYLLISSSRGMDLPNNLQGIWNNDNNPAWQCDIHSNINIQMNYWPAEVAALPELHNPFINYIVSEATRENGSWRRLAKSIGCRGWYVNTQSNIFGYTDWNANRPANAWYCLHLWDHYAFTTNKDYLRDKAFPVMKSACEFWFDRLKEDSNGRLIAPDEWSPEQGDWEDGVTYAQQLVWELFDRTMLACKILGCEDNDFTQELHDKFRKLDNGLTIGDWGQIREWRVQPDIKGNDHRHLSNLIALYPGYQITSTAGKDLEEAARTTLISRGDLGTGWSRAWKISCWARLHDGDHAYRLLKSALKFTDHIPLSMDNDKGGIYANLFDAHPPFQIDGNFGATAGICEMLIQSHNGYIEPLPALPSAWQDGSVQGLKARGNFTVDIEWESGSLKSCTLSSHVGEPCRIHIPDGKTPKAVTSGGKTIEYRVTDGVIQFETKPNTTYQIEI